MAIFKVYGSRRCCVAAGILTLCLLAALPLSMQAAPEADPGPTRKSVEKLLQDLDSSTVASETRQSLRDTYLKALASIDAATDLETQAASLQEQARAAPQERERLKALVAGGVTGFSPNLSSGTPISLLEQTLDRASAELSVLREKLATETSEMDRMITRRKDVPRLLVDARQKSESLEESLKSLAQPGTDRDEARRLLARAQLVQTRAEIKRFEIEMAGFDALLELGKLRKDLLSNKVMAGEIQEKTFRGIVDDRRLQDAEAAANRARETVRDLSAEFPFLSSLAEENAALAEQRRIATVRLEEISRESASYSQTLAKYQDEHKSIRDKIQAIGFSDAIGILLRVKKAELPSLSGFQETLEQRQQEISVTQLKLIELEESITSLRDLEARAGELLSGHTENLSPDRRKAVVAKVKDLLRQRRDFLETLQRDLSSYFSRLVDLDTLARQIAKKSREFAAFINERILWVRSCQPLGVQDIARFARGISWLFSPGQWFALGVACLSGFAARPFLVVFLLVICGVLIAQRGRFNARQVEIARLVQRAVTDRFLLTIEAVTLTALYSVPWPFMLWIVSLLVGFAPDVGEFPREAAGLLGEMVVPLWGFEFFRQVFRPLGLADAHCQWHLGEVHPLLQRRACLLGWIVLPLVHLSLVVRNLATDQIQDSLGRFLFLFTLLAVAWLLDPLTRPSGPVMKAVGGRSTDRFFFRLRYPVFFLAVIFPIAMGIATSMGFFYTAQQLWAKAVFSLVLIIAGLFVYSLVWRALNVHRRSLALHKSQVMRAVQDLRPRPELTGGIDASSMKPVSEPSIYILSAQTEKLLFVILAVLLVVGLFHIWSEVFPALRIFDQVKLWNTETRVYELVSTPDGSTRREWVEKTVDITLFDLFVAGAIIFLTVTASRNLPGFLEFSLLQRLELDAGTKFAVRTIARYLIGLIGFVLVFENIGLGWDKIQWLAAGVSVGLGFGMQEIFANFISGLIILFERPIRVGDTVTVSDVTGTITRIQIRATTLLNFDRKEVIIPNKELITGCLTNWTLTDSIQRIVFVVGVAYGSEPDRVRDILLGAARGHPRVLVDPSPQALFVSFGDSSLNFELRVFIGSLDGYVDLQHEINCRVLTALNEAGIEIPFPHREIILKNGPQPASASTSGFEKNGASEP